MSRWALRRMLALGALATVLTVGALTVLHMGAVL